MDAGGGVVGVVDENAIFNKLLIPIPVELLELLCAGVAVALTLVVVEAEAEFEVEDDEGKDATNDAKRDSFGVGVGDTA
jgi:hypothetical protein